MKSSLLTITLGIVLFSILIGTSSISHADSRISVRKVLFSSNEKEVIIQVSESNEKNLPEIRKNIELTGGMTFRGYCKELKVLLYIMDTNQHPDYSFLNVAFMNVSLGYIIKEGTILQVQNTCNMPATADPNQAQD